MQLVKDLGLKVLRYGLPYHRIHLGIGKYDWSFADEVMHEIKRLGTAEVWQQLGWTAIERPVALEPGDKVWMQTRHLLAPLDRLLQIRRQMGLRNPAHSIVKLLDPIYGSSTAQSVVLPPTSITPTGTCVNSS